VPPSPKTLARMEVKMLLVILGLGFTFLELSGALLISSLVWLKELFFKGL
jgi:hypothetical protein